MLKMAISISETSKLNSLPLLVVELTFAYGIFPLLPEVGNLLPTRQVVSTDK